MTEQGIANIRKAHAEQAKRVTTSVRVPGKRDRIQAMRKAEILRMTNEGMSAAQIAENLQARGVELGRGAATVERLRTIWGLLPESERNIENIRQSYRGQAHKLQKDQFESIATELGIQDVKAWVKSKMNEESALEARREYAYKLMGHLRPRPVDPKTMKGIVKHWKSTMARNDTENHPAASQGVEVPDQRVTSAQPETPSGSHGPLGLGVADDPIDLSDDDDDMDSEDDEDCEGDDDQAAPAEDVKSQLSPLDRKVDLSGSHSSQASSANASRHPPPQTTAMDIDHPLDGRRRSQATLPHPPVPNGTTDPNLPGGLIYPQYWTGTNMQERPPGPYGLGQHQPAHAAPSRQQQPPAQLDNAPPVSSAPFEPPSQGWVEPQIVGPSTQMLGPSTTGPRRIAPKPAAPGPIVQPFVTRLPHAITPPGEAEMMAKFGLYPFATFRRPPQKYLTPSGLVITEGYEYLPCAPGFPGFPGSMPDYLSGGGAVLPQTSTQPDQPANTHQLPPDVIIVGGAAAPPRPSSIPAPTIVIPIPPEEAERHRASHDAIEKHHKAALECMAYLAARADGRPLRDSLTGLPPSLKDVEGAKGRLKEAAEAMLASL